MQLDRHIFVVGAGISVDPPSHIPPAGPICDFLMRWLSGEDKEVCDKLRERSRPGNSHNPYDFIRFEALIHRIAQLDPGIITQLALLETYGFPNAHHVLLAMALRGGASVITTNFDNRIELAGALLDWSVPVMRLSRRSPGPPEAAMLVKVHGSFPSFRALSPREVSRALEHAKEAAYYSLRTGSDYWFADALRQYANFLNRFGKHREARQILILGIDWISPVNTTDRAVIMWCAAVSALREGNKRLARDIRQKLDELPAASWQGKKLFTLIYDAYRSVMARRQIEAGNLLDEAEALLGKVPHLDTWGHSENIRRLRNQIDVLSRR